MKKQRSQKKKGEGKIRRSLRESHVVYHREKPVRPPFAALLPQVMRTRRLRCAAGRASCAAPAAMPWRPRTHLRWRSPLACPARALGRTPPGAAARWLRRLRAGAPGEPAKESCQRSRTCRVCVWWACCALAAGIGNEEQKRLVGFIRERLESRSEAANFKTRMMMMFRKSTSDDSGAQEN